MQVRVSGHSMHDVGIQSKGCGNFGVRGNRVWSQEVGEFVGLEWSKCVASTCFSDKVENVVSQGIVFSGCAMVEKACCVGISCRS